MQLADLAVFTTSKNYAKTTVDPTVQSFFFNLTYREHKGFQQIPEEAYQGDERMMPHKFMFRVFGELKADNRENISAYWACLKHITPHDVADYLMLRRNSRKVSNAAKALGWSEIEARGQLRTDKEEAIAANVRAEAKAKNLKGKKAVQFHAEANRKRKERDLVQITGIKSALSAIWRFAGVSSSSIPPPLPRELRPVPCMLIACMRSAGESNQWRWTDVEKTEGKGNAALSKELTLLRQKTKKQDADMGKLQKQAATLEQEDLVQAQKQARRTCCVCIVCVYIVCVYTMCIHELCGCTGCVYPCVYTHVCMHLLTHARGRGAHELHTRVLCCSSCTRSQIYAHWLALIATFVDGEEFSAQLSYKYDKEADSPQFTGYDDVQRQRRECKAATEAAANQFVLASIVLFATIVTINGFHRSEACSHHQRLPP